MRLGSATPISPASFKLLVTLSFEVNHGKGIRALEILKQEKNEQVSEEVSQEGSSNQVEQAEQSEVRVRSAIP